MTRDVACACVGKWRIVEADLWDRDCPDLVEPARITFRGDGMAELERDGALEIEIRYHRGDAAILKAHKW